MIYNTEMINLLNKLEQFEFVQYEKVFQNLFYFAKIAGEQINEDNTHKLSWKKGRKIWPSILDIIKNYDPIGPKPEQIPEIFKGNVILDNLRPFIETEKEEEKEEMNNYSYSIEISVQYVVEI